MQQTLKRRFSRLILVLLAAPLAFAFRGSLRAQSEAPPASQFPAEWSEAVKALAEKIASSAGRAKTISLDVENISSLSGSDAARIRESLEADLKQRQFTIGEQQAAKVRVTMTLSEGVDGYVWVAQVRGESGEQTAIVSVHKSDVSAKDPEKEAVLLGKKLIWQQPVKFLDFALGTTPDGTSWEVVVLETDRFAYYRSTSAAQWVFWQAIPIAHSSAWAAELRDLRGFIDNETGVASLPGTTCTESLDPSKVHCGPEDQKLVFPWRRIKVPGHGQSETMSLSYACGAKTVVLSTGNADWTQPDQVQGYLAGTLDEDIHASGAALPMEGPVISFQRDAKGSGARAIVHNLKTDEYEGYVITASCST